MIVMETGYCQIRQKDVINLRDGRKLGKVCDVVFLFPEGRVLGIIVPGGRGFFQPEQFIELKNIVRIGEDAILVDVSSFCKAERRRKRDYPCGESCEQSQPCSSRSFDDGE